MNSWGFSFIMMKTWEIRKGLTIPSIVIQFLCGLDFFMMMKTIEMWEGFTIVNTITGFLFIVVSFVILNMTDG